MGLGYSDQQRVIKLTNLEMKEQNPTFDSIKKEYLRIPEENQTTDAAKFHNVGKSMQLTSQKQLNL
jgi:hypothetical protein